MEKSSVKHTMNNEYCYALDKDTIMIRISLKANDVKEVYLHYQDKYINIHTKDTRKVKKMTLVASDGISDYYEAIINVHMICIRYYFEFISNNSANNSHIHDFYGNNKFFTKDITDIGYMFDCPQPAKEEEMFIIPDWAKGAVVYQIFPDRFATDKKINNDKWYKTPMHYNDKLHGNLRGIINKIDYLKDLGVDVLYLTPIFRSNSNHKYDTIDYYQIDPDFGTKEELRELVNVAHDKGMRVILDGVFNHTSPNFFAFEDLVKNNEASKYVDWYYPDSFPIKTTGKPNFLTFGYYGGMPKLNCSNSEVRNYIYDVVSYWIRECDIDGWRLDAADEVAHDFWKSLRKKIKSIKPDALIIGEIWHYTSSYLQGDEWDTIMNYNFRSTVADYIATHTITASDFVNEFGYIRGNAHTHVHQILWNLIDSHDTGRFLHCAGERKEALKLAATIQMITPGMPMIYYGDEVGITGGQDPDCRRGMLWDPELQDKDIYNWYKKLIHIRKNNSCLTNGIFKYLEVNDNNDLIVIRAYNDTQERYIIIHNNEKTVTVNSLAGKTNLLTNEVFNGTVKPYETIIL